MQNIYLPICGIEIGNNTINNYTFISRTHLPNKDTRGNHGNQMLLILRTLSDTLHNKS